jgi:hypothetical protein
MGVGGVMFAKTPRAFASAAESARNVRLPTVEDIIGPAGPGGVIRSKAVGYDSESGVMSFGGSNPEKAGIIESTGSITKTESPISRISQSPTETLVAKQAFENRRASYIRSQETPVGTDIVTNAYKLSRKEGDPISDIIAKQAFERRTEAAVRNLNNAGKTDVVTRAYEMSRKEPAVAPWERDTIPTSFDLKTLKVGRSSEFKSPGVSGTQQPASESLAVARDLLSRVPEPSNTLPEPAIQSWERAELLKKLYPEEYGGSTSFGEIVVEPKNIFKFGGYSDSKPILESKLLEPQKQPESTTVSRPTTLPYKDAINVERLNKLLPKEKELNIPTESELQSVSLRENIGKGYDWNKARKMGTVGESTSTTPEVLLQLQPRVSPASKARAYAEVSPYTSIPSNLELSAINERTQVASSRKTAVESVTATSLISDALSDIKPITQTKTNPVTELAYDRITMPDAATETITTEDLFRLPQPQQSPMALEQPLFETTWSPEPFTGFPPARGSTGGKIPPPFTGIPSPSGGGGAGGVKDPFRKIQREILYIGPRSYGPKRTTKKRKK